MRTRSSNVVDQLRSQGVIALEDWVSQCIAYLTTTGAISNHSNETKVLDAVLRVYLDYDIYVTKDEVNQLPQNINELHNVRLFPEQLRVLQIDEVVDIGASSQRASQETAKAEEEEEQGAQLQPSAFGKHLLKAFLSDGEQHVVGLDINGTLLAAYHAHVSRIRGPDKPSIFTFFAGAKIAVKNVLVRRGALVLTVDSVKFLGGAVARLQDLNAGQTAVVPASVAPTPSTAPTVAAPRHTPSVPALVPLSARMVNCGAAKGTAEVPSHLCIAAPAATTKTLAVTGQVAHPQLEQLLQVGITSAPVSLSPLPAVQQIDDRNVYSTAPMPPPSTALSHPSRRPLVVPLPSAPALMPASAYASMQPYDDGGFYDEGPLLTCDLTMSQSPNRPVQSHVSPEKVENAPNQMQLWFGPDVDTVTRGLEDDGEERGVCMEVDGSNSEDQKSPRWTEDQPSEWHCGHSQFEDTENINVAAGGVGTSDALTEPAPLQRWEQILQDWGCNADMSSESFVRVRGITNRLIRLKTKTANPELSGGKPQFDVALELDDGHTIVACQVSNDLVERFLDMSAADYCALLEQLQGDRVARKQTVRGVMNRFQHFHGLFWVCRKTTTATANPCSTKAKRSQQPDELPEKALLVDFADEDVAGLCRAALWRQQRSSVR